MLNMCTQASICYKCSANGGYAMRVRSLQHFNCCFLLHSISFTCVKVYGFATSIKLGGFVGPGCTVSCSWMVL